VLVVSEHFIDISKKLTTEDVLKSLQGSIAVVGSATMLGDHGAEIDGFDNVVRFSSYVLEGFESRVGTRTTLWSTYGDFDTLPLHNSIAVSPFQKYGHESVIVTPRLQIIYAENDIHKIMGAEYPTTGGALLALFHYLKIPVTAFFFDFLESQHYYNDCFIEKGVHVFDIEQEKKFVLNSEYIKVVK
jgi:hypothetical protein